MFVLTLSFRQFDISIWTCGMHFNKIISTIRETKSRSFSIFSSVRNKNSHTKQFIKIECVLKAPMVLEFSNLVRLVRNTENFESETFQLRSSLSNFVQYFSTFQLKSYQLLEFSNYFESLSQDNLCYESQNFPSWCLFSNFKCSNFSFFPITLYNCM